MDEEDRAATPTASPVEPSSSSLEASTSTGSYKISPLKHADGEALTREDIQYDLLHYIFEDTRAVFTEQAPDLTVAVPRPPRKITFSKLYINAILHSPKCTKVSREKMVDTPSYGIEYAKLCLLVNVGRINTTLACMSILFNVYDALICTMYSLS